MPRTLYNEGRVVGYSAYEIYCRQLYATDPTATPSDEKAWLAATLAMGSSMLLRVGSDNIDGNHYRNIQLPETSKLCAANNIMASFFIGEGDIGDATDSDSVWITKVTDYGSLIGNNDTVFPSGIYTHNVQPSPKSDVSISESMYDQVLSYMNITDGIIIQPGTWTDNSDAPPKMNFAPTLADYPMLRLSFADKVETPFYLLLTGFTDKGILIAESALTHSTSTTNPEDGDFLGPAVFPWSAKVIFSVPPFAMNVVFGNNFKYTRKFSGQGATTVKTVDSVPIIDFMDADPAARSTSDPEVSKYGDFYDQTRKSVNVNALEIRRSSASVLSTYSIRGASPSITYLPPAIYGMVIDSSGEYAMYPLDNVAPNSIHMYQDDEGYDAYNYSRVLEQHANYAKSFVRDSSSYVVNEYDSAVDDFIPVASTRKISALGALISDPKTLPYLYVEGTGLRPGLTQKWNGTDYSTTGHVGGEIVPKNTPSRDTPEIWYIEVDDSLVSEYSDLIETFTIYLNATDTQEVSGIKGTVAMTDKLMCAGVRCMMYRRFTGKLSDVIKQNCGYQSVYDSDGDPIGVFAPGGIWGTDSNTRYLFNQIDASDRHNYYAVFQSSSSNEVAFPIRSEDNYIDVTYKYNYDVYINGSIWNIPHFLNNPPTGNNRNAVYLGSWWDAIEGDSKLVSDTYDNGWALIHDAVESHPTAYSIVEEQGSGQIYQQLAMLPVRRTYATPMRDIFGESVLTAAGIKTEFQELSIYRFLQTALYTDMGTGKVLSSSNPNIKLATRIYTNGYDEDTQTYSRDNMTMFVSLNVSNSAGNAGKAQILYLPNDMTDVDSNDPTAILISSGRQQSIALSMTDIDNVPYTPYGTSGTLNLSDAGLLTWDMMLRSLAENKKLNVIGEILSTLATSISGSGSNYLEFSDASANPIRIYVSRAAPSDSDIPDGSVGIGWGSGIHTYTGGAWT